MRETLLRILLKLARAMEQGMGASELAVRWGNVDAYSWRSDHGFWLGIAKDFWRKN